MGRKSSLNPFHLKSFSRDQLPGSTWSCQTSQPQTTKWVPVTEGGKKKQQQVESSSRRVALTTIRERRASDAQRSPHGASVFVLKLPANEYQCDWRTGYGRMGSVILVEGGEHRVFQTFGELRSWRGLWGSGEVMCLFFHPKAEYVSRAAFNSDPGSNSTGIPDRVCKKIWLQQWHLFCPYWKAETPFVRLTAFGECCH